MLPRDADHQQSGYMCFASMLTLSYLKQYTHIRLNAYSYINDSSSNLSFLQSCNLAVFKYCNHAVIFHSYILQCYNLAVLQFSFILAQTLTLSFELDKICLVYDYTRNKTVDDQYYHTFTQTSSIAGVIHSVQSEIYKQKYPSTFLLWLVCCRVSLHCFRILKCKIARLVLQKWQHSS